MKKVILDLVGVDGNAFTVNEMAMVLLMHIVVLGRRLSAEAGNG